MSFSLLTRLKKSSRISRMISTNREYFRIFSKIYEDFWQILKIFESTKHDCTNRNFVRANKNNIRLNKKIFARTKNIRTNKKNLQPKTFSSYEDFKIFVFFKNRRVCVCTKSIVCRPSVPTFFRCPVFYHFSDVA